MNTGSKFFDEAGQRRPNGYLYQRCAESLIRENVRENNHEILLETPETIAVSGVSCGGDGEIRTHKDYFHPTFSCAKVC